MLSPDRFRTTEPEGRDRGPESGKVWMVESTAAYETYSNGLRVEKQWATPNRPRPRYRVFSRELPKFDRFGWREGVAGIVFHTTESHIAPFQEEANNQLRRVGRNLLAEIQIRRCYHYLIDRFGRVWRVVEEDQVAWHAGKSVWADPEGVYVNLNDSFLGVSFEAQTYHQEQPIATPAQIHAARILTEMLRAKYRIPAANCVTHAQVSVSAASMKVGYHTDWAANFPYAEMGLSDNYGAPLPALWAFGFQYDEIFRRATGERMWRGLEKADAHLREQAKRAGLAEPQYRQILQQRYKELIAALYSADEEQANES